MSWTTDIKFTKGSYAISWSSLHTHRFLSSRHEIQLIKLQFYSASKVTFRPMKVWETLTHIKSMLFLPFLANYLIFMWVHVKSLQSCLTLCDPMDCSLPGSSVFLGFSRQEYWGGLWFPSPGDLPDPGIEPTSLTSLALAGGFFTTSTTWEALWSLWKWKSLSCVQISATSRTVACQAPLSVEFSRQEYWSG